MKAPHTAIIYAHPYEKSFNHAILTTLREAVAARGEECTVIDLYADGFDPVYHPEELALFREGRYLDPLIERYQTVLTAATRVVFVFPVWWCDMPAVLKGFFDKVMLPGYGYSIVGGEWRPGLSGIAQTLVITTSDAPTEMFAPYLGGYFLRNCLDSVGMSPNEWHNCPAVTSPDGSARAAFLEMLPGLLK